MSSVWLTNVSHPAPVTYVVSAQYIFSKIETQGTWEHSPDHSRENRDSQPWATTSVTHVLQPLGPVLPPRVSMGLVSMTEVSGKEHAQGTLLCHPAALSLHIVHSCLQLPSAIPHHWFFSLPSYSLSPQLNCKTQRRKSWVSALFSLATRAQGM